LLPARTGSGASTFVTATSATVWTVVVCVAELLAVFGSGLVESTVAVLLSVAPPGVLELTRTTNVKTCGPAVLARMPRAADTVPVPPAGGTVVAQPAGAVNETNVVFVGRGS